MTSLIGIHTTDDNVTKYMVYNPSPSPIPEIANYLVVESNVFKVGKVTSNDAGTVTETLATAHFNELHIGGGYNGIIPDRGYDNTNSSGGGLTIFSNGDIYTNGTIQSAIPSGRLAAPTMMQRQVEETFSSQTIKYNDTMINKIVIYSGNNNIDLCNTWEDKRVLGVLSGVNRNGKMTVNYSGEGYIWVCNAGGNLEVGDYITTSSMSGIGIRQKDDSMMNYTVAKITQNCDFNVDTMKVKYIRSDCTEITKDEYSTQTGFIITCVKCMYSSG